MKTLSDQEKLKLLELLKDHKPLCLFCEKVFSPQGEFTIYPHEHGFILLDNKTYWIIYNCECGEIIALAKIIPVQPLEINGSEKYLDLEKELTLLDLQLASPEVKREALEYLTIRLKKRVLDFMMQNLPHNVRKKNHTTQEQFEKEEDEKKVIFKDIEKILPEGFF